MRHDDNRGDFGGLPCDLLRIEAGWTDATLCDLRELRDAGSQAGHRGSSRHAPQANSQAIKDEIDMGMPTPQKQLGKAEELSAKLD